MPTPMRLAPTTKSVQKSTLRFIKNSAVILGLTAVVFTTIIVYTNLGVSHDSTAKNQNFSHPVSHTKIVLEYFKGTNLQENEVVLKWATKSERNNDYFSIERSEDGKIFETIKQINGAGNSNKKLYYDFTDYYPARGTNYYRLKQTDYDGKFEYSKVIIITVQDDNMKP